MKTFVLLKESIYYTVLEYIKFKAYLQGPHTLKKTQGNHI